MDYQIALGIIATAIGLAGFVPYFREVARGRNKPHAFSWLIWGTLQAATGLAQLSRGGGAGAWAVGVPSILCFAAFVVALFKGEKRITRLDTTCLVAAFIGIGLWLLTANPLWEVVIACMVDVVGFIPTVMKAYLRPTEESTSVYTYSVVSFGLSLFALQALNLTTVLYPAMQVLTCGAFVLIVLARRGTLKGRKKALKEKY